MCFLIECARRCVIRRQVCPISLALNYCTKPIYNLVVVVVVVGGFGAARYGLFGGFVRQGIVKSSRIS